MASSPVYISLRPLLLSLKPFFDPDIATMPQTTVIIVWVSTWIAVCVMCARLILIRIHKKPFASGDYLTAGAIFCAVARLSLIHVVLIWGNNNFTPSFRADHKFTPQEIYHREIGGKLTIVDRVFYSS